MLLPTRMPTPQSQVNHARFSLSDGSDTAADQPSLSYAQGDVHSAIMNLDLVGDPCPVGRVPTII